uniref:Uncharacterized protein n=1 Tax=Cynoglossus semilaevis TaxID=244447 RepID=A0A3P8VJI8_CYNSE
MASLHLAVPLPAVLMITVTLYMMLLGLGLWIRFCLKVGAGAAAIMTWLLSHSSISSTVTVLVNLTDLICGKWDCACTCQPPECESCNCLCFEIRIK